jgi:predicted GNAT family acetyltransferase
VTSIPTEDGPVPTAEITVTNNEEASRYEAWVEERLCRIDYELRGDVIAYLHAGVPSELEGRGIAAALTRAALEDARRRHLRVVPVCSYVRAYIGRHSEYLPLLANR